MLEEKKLKTIIDIDDSSSSQSILRLEVKYELKRVMFIPIFQRGYCDWFFLYPSDIDKMVEFLLKAKQELCQNKEK